MDLIPVQLWKMFFLLFLKSYYFLFLYLIVPFKYALAAYRSSLIEPRFIFWRDVHVVEPDMPPKRTKKVQLGFCQTRPS